MYGHPLQLMITCLTMMAVCVAGGVYADRGNTGALGWCMFIALCIMAFGVLLPAGRTYHQCRRRY